MDKGSKYIRLSSYFMHLTVSLTFQAKNTTIEVACVFSINELYKPDSSWLRCRQTIRSLSTTSWKQSTTSAFGPLSWLLAILISFLLQIVGNYWTLSPNDLFTWCNINMLGLPDRRQRLHDEDMLCMQIGIECQEMTLMLLAEPLNPQLKTRRDW